MVNPHIYDIVIIFPANSFLPPSTFKGANSIGRDPANPFVTPRNAVKTNGATSPDIVGLRLGETHNNSNGMMNVLSDDNNINCLRVQLYGIEAHSFPTKSNKLKTNISRTGLCQLNDCKFN